MTKPKYVDYKLDTSHYKLFPCFRCLEKATHRFGERDSDGIGYNMEALCEKHYIEVKQKTMEVK